MSTRLLLCALVLWSLSFLMGLRFLSGIQTAINLSKTIQDDANFVRQANVEFQQEIEKLVDESKEKMGSRQDWAQKIQLLCLILGAFALTFSKVDVMAALNAI